MVRNSSGWTIYPSIVIIEKNLIDFYDTKLKATDRESLLKWKDEYSWPWTNKFRSVAFNAEKYTFLILQNKLP